MTLNRKFRRAAWALGALGLAIWTLSLSSSAAIAAGDSEEVRQAKEKELIAVLASNAEGGEKAIACKKLAIYGSAKAVPELAKLLSDERLSSWTRIALESIPGAEADQALLDALDGLKGRPLVGTINSIGVRRVVKAIEPLTKRLDDKDTLVANCAAASLGKIGGTAAAKTLRARLKTAPAGVRDAVAEGCVLCAERMMAEGHDQEAAELYDEVRKADVPKQRILEGTRGAILARKADGIPLLIEQLRSKDKSFFQIGLSTAREIPGRDAAYALESEIAKATPERAALVLLALADRRETITSSAVLHAAASGPKEVRLVALEVLGKLGDSSCLSTMLEIALEKDAELAQGAKAALATLPGADVNAEIAARLDKSDGPMVPLLLELVGERRILAKAALLKAVEHKDPAVRGAALTALGETIDLEGVGVLVDKTIEPKSAEEGKLAQDALKAACVRMPEREACAEKLAAAMSKASVETRCQFLEILASMGGAQALECMETAAKSDDPRLQDVGSRLLGAWMSVDAGPVLLDLAKTASSEKYQVRAARGYIRLARQFVMPDEDRVAMCKNALAIAPNVAERKLTLEVIQRYPSMGMLELAAKTAEDKELKNEATQVTLLIAQKLGAKGADIKALLVKVGLKPIKLEIVSAEYGAGDKKKDVTETLRKLAGETPLLALPSATYNQSFGGDPAPDVVKQLKIKYRVDGKDTEATFAENAVILLPIPQ